MSATRIQSGVLALISILVLISCGCREDAVVICNDRTKFVVNDLGVVVHQSYSLGDIYYLNNRDKKLGSLVGNIQTKTVEIDTTTSDSLIKSFNRATNIKVSGVQNEKLQGVIEAQAYQEFRILLTEWRNEQISSGSVSSIINSQTKVLEGIRHDARGKRVDLVVITNCTFAKHLDIGLSDSRGGSTEVSFGDKGSIGLTLGTQCSSQVSITSRIPKLVCVDYNYYYYDPATDQVYADLDRSSPAQTKMANLHIDPDRIVDAAMSFAMQKNIQDVEILQREFLDVVYSRVTAGLKAQRDYYQYLE